MSNDWQVIDKEILSHSEFAIVKMLRGVISENNTLKGMYTTLLNKDKVRELESYVVPFPGLYQKFIEKHREWRVTVIDEDIFSTAIYTKGDATVDWREYQLSPDVEFRAEKLSDNISELCLRYLASFGLKYGAFDLIESFDGATYFLECNPNGEYGWLESELGFPISQSIAKTLIKLVQ